MLGRRLQILLDEDRYRRLQTKGRETRKSVGALIREAIDVAYPAASSRRTAALRAILQAPTIVAPPPEGLRAELDELRSRRA